MNEETPELWEVISDDLWDRPDDCCPQCESDTFTIIATGLLRCDDCRYIGTESEFRYR